MLAFWWAPLVLLAVGVWAAILVPRLAAEHVTHGRAAQAVTLAILGVAPPVLVATGPHQDPLNPTAGAALATVPLWGQHLAMLALLALAAVAALVHTGRAHTGSAVLAAIAGFSAATAVTLLGSPAATVLALLPLLPAAVFYFSGADWPTTVRDLRWGLRVTVWPSLGLALRGPLWATVDDERSLIGVARLAGLTGHPNALGGVAAALLLLELTGPRHRRWLLYTAIAAGTLVLTGSRTAILGCILGLLWMLATRRGIGRWIAGGGTVVVLARLLWSPPTIGELTGRADLWTYAWAEFVKHPVWGYGANFLTLDYRATYLPKRLSWAGQAHDQLLHTLAVSGLVGGVALAVYLTVLAAVAVRTARHTGGATVGLFGLLIAECFTESPLLPVLGPLFFVHMAVLAGLLAGLRAHRSSLDAGRSVDRPSQVPLARPTSNLRTSSGPVS